MRPIDADALLEDGIRVSYAYNNDGIILIPMGEVRQSIKNAPTIDAVPVVRCKDCVAVSVCNDKLVCSRISDVIDGYYHGTVEVVKPDDYCSKGIRRSCAKMGGAEDDHKGTRKAAADDWLSGRVYGSNQSGHNSKRFANCRK